MAESRKIHVMQLIHTLAFGGAERLAGTISASLAREHFDVSVCGLFGEEGPLVEELQRHNVRYFYLKAESKSKLVLFLELFRLLKDKKVDVIQVHGAYGLLFCFLPARLAGVKIIYTEHAKQSIVNKKSIGFAARYLSDFVEKVVCVSDNLRTFFIDKLGVNESRLQLIHNGINTERFMTTDLPFSSGESDKTIGCIARLTEAKDHDNLLTAFSQILVRRGGVRLKIVGDGELRNSIEERIAALGIASHVDMLGSRDDIPELLSKMDIFVLPSKREGFPVAILEAMAAGRPVIATDVGGVREVISSGSNGLIIPPENSDALTDALLFFLDHPADAQRIAQCGITTVKERFSVNSMIKTYTNLFQSLVNC